jgi:molybdate transport system substrate-binding protein
MPRFRPSQKLSRRSVIASALPVLFAANAQAANPPVIVAAASDLQGVLAVLAQAFEFESGIPVRVTFGSSGNLARQLRQGAPFELFFSADEELVLALAKDGHVRDKGVVYAEGRLALMVHTSSPLAAKLTIEAFAAALKSGRVRRVTIANPEHAPYGRRALDVFTQLHITEFVRPKLVYGENVAQAAQFVATGAAEAGIVAHALTVSEAVMATTRSTLIPASWHRPLLQRMALTPRATGDAAQFYAYIQSPIAAKAFRDHGFAVPGL